jgi:hypothetical protein
MNSIPVSMINEVMGVQKSDNSNLYVGLGGTMFVGSDQYAMVITEVISSKVVRVAHMDDEDWHNNVLLDENGNHYLPVYQMSKYARVNDERTSIVPDGSIFTLRKNDRWIKKGAYLWGTCAVHFGAACNYRDPNF